MQDELLKSLITNDVYRQQYIPYNARGGGGGDPNKRGKYQGPNNGENKDGQIPQRVPPPNYVCYRCGQKGMK